MFRRDFLSSLASLWPFSRLLKGGDTPLLPPGDERVDFPSHLIQSHGYETANYINPDFSSRVEMKGCFKVAGGPAVLNQLSVKVRNASMSGRSCHSPIPRCVAGYRRVMLNIKVDSAASEVYWETVDQEILSQG